MNKDEVTKKLLAEGFTAKDIDGKNANQLNKFLENHLAKKDADAKKLADENAAKLKAEEDVKLEETKSDEEVKLEEDAKLKAEEDAKSKDDGIPDIVAPIKGKTKKLIACKFIKDLPHQSICGNYYAYKDGEDAKLPTSVYAILKNDKVVA